MTKFTGIIFAHRGASGYEHENTFAAFDRAIQMGADGLETDCWLLKDGTIVLHHDKGIKLPGDDKITNISNLTYDELKKYNLPNGEKIPTIDDFFTRYKDVKNKSNDPLKFSIDCQDLKVGIELAKIIESLHLVDRVYLCGSPTLTLKKIRRTSSKVKLVASNQAISPNADEFDANNKYMSLNVEVFNFQASEYNDKIDSLLKEKGYKIFIWDLQEKDDLIKYMGYQPDAIYTNYPDRAVEVKSLVNT